LLPMRSVNDGRGFEAYLHLKTAASSLSELIFRKSGNHCRRGAFPCTVAPDAEQGFDFHA
jgi:hypothetical protein